MHILIPAAGMGKRMGAGHNKLRLQLLGKPLLAWTLAAVAAAEAIEWIGVIGQPEDFSTWEALLGDLNLRQPVQLIEGVRPVKPPFLMGYRHFPKGLSRC